MKRRWVIEIAIGLAIGLITSFFVLRSAEPKYNGTRLTGWLDRNSLVALPYGEFDLDADAANAMKHFGSNAIPFLLDRIQYEPSALKVRIWSSADRGWPAWAQGRATDWLVSRDGFNRAEVAAIAFPDTGPEAKCAIPQLTKIMLGTGSLKSHVNRRAASCLAQLGPEALPAMMEALKRKAWFAPHYLALMSKRGVDVQSALPLLLQYLADDNDPALAINSASALGLMELRDDRVIAALAEAAGMKCPNGIRHAAMHALPRFGPFAKPALPVLIENLNDPDVLIAEVAVQQLGRLKLEANLTVPAIVQAIRRRHQSAFTIAAANALGAFGVAARTALPDLKAIVDTDADTTADGKPEQRALRRAIQSIDGRQR